MEDFLKNCIDNLLKDYSSIEALYLYGSYINGYYKKDSDIDLVALTKIHAKNDPINFPPNISVHMVNPSVVEFFESGIPYTHLRMIPVYNKEKCEEISERLKSELVRRELIRFKRKGISDFSTLDPIYNYLLGYAIKRPWRIKPIKRIFKSEETKQILHAEYKNIMNKLEKRGMIKHSGDIYTINKNFVFDGESATE